MADKLRGSGALDPAIQQALFSVFDADGDGIQSQIYDRGVGIACLLRQTLESSFSAVSKPNFASKYEILVGKLSPRSTQCTPLHRSHGISSG